MVVESEDPLMVAPLAEPAVLAVVKETLYPNLNTDSEQSAVTETQFTTPTWGGLMCIQELSAGCSAIRHHQF